MEAGLPNIIGSYNTTASGYGGEWSSTSGAFQVISYSGGTSLGQQDGALHQHGFDFDASKCSPIYGKSSTVQPPAVTVRYYIRAK